MIHLPVGNQRELRPNELYLVEEHRVRTVVERCVVELANLVGPNADDHPVSLFLDLHASTRYSIETLPGATKK